MYLKICYSYCFHVADKIYHTTLQSLIGKKCTKAIYENISLVFLFFQSIFIFINTLRRKNTNAGRNFTRISIFSTNVNMFSTKVRRNIARVSKKITRVSTNPTAMFLKLTDVRKRFARAGSFSAKGISFNKNSQNDLQNSQNVYPDVCFVYTGHKFNILNRSNILFSAFHY